MKSIPPLAEKSLFRDWRMLCEEIGERRAGSAGEARAAAYVAHELRAAGATEVRLEEFPCTGMRSARVSVGVRTAKGWRRTEANPLVGAPGTPDGRFVEGEIVWLEMPEAMPRLESHSLRGKIAVIFGPLPSQEEQHRRLVRAEPAAVIHVDERLPFEWPKSDGVYPYWARKHGMPPTVAVPYRAAWEWRQADARRARVQVRVTHVENRSQNVIGELPGRDPRLPAIVLAAHHDTQCGNPGADDNASGVVCILALARLLAERKRERTVRVVSFGAEEQLSVGSSFHVRMRQRELRRTCGLVINFDSVSSPLGHFEMLCAGDSSLGTYARSALARRGLDVVLRQEITPFVDNFPFNAAGVPSLCFMRTNMPGGRWQHHSRHDTLENCSAGEVVRLLSAVFPLAAELSLTRRWRFAGSLPAEQRRSANKLRAELFGS